MALLHLYPTTTTTTNNTNNIPTDGEPNSILNHNNTPYSSHNNHNNLNVNIASPSPYRNSTNHVSNTNSPLQCYEINNSNIHNSIEQVGGGMNNHHPNNTHANTMGANTNTLQFNTHNMSNSSIMNDNTTTDNSSSNNNNNQQQQQLYGQQQQQPYGGTTNNMWGYNNQPNTTTTTNYEPNMVPYNNQQAPTSNNNNVSQQQTTSKSPGTTTTTTKSDVFVQDSMGWSCRHCNTMPYSYRAPGSIWQSAEPPSSSFIEQHLQVCRGNASYYAPPPPQHHGAAWGAGPMNPYGAPPPPHGYAPYHPANAAYPGQQSQQQPQQPGPGAGGPQNNSNSVQQLHQGMVSQTGPAVQPQSANFVHAPEIPELNGPVTPGSLAQQEDRLLLTDYFYYLMQQLKVCHFSEADRKTRGGKRDNIANGYGGMQCRHCAGRPDARKFFWSDVDRLANSFAEIPSHIMRCKRAPPDVKSNLSFLKTRHPEQMARLPRGSQKVYFRRMWRRLHGDKTELDDSTGSADGATSPDGKESIMSAAQNGRILLAIAEDKEWLSDVDCFVRKNLEVFCATERDVALAHNERKYPVLVGHVGIRCIHCAHSQEGAHGSAVSFPHSIGSIYESVREFQKLHMESCPHTPPEVITKLNSLTTSTSLTSVLRRYYILAAKALGMVEAADGIRASAESGLNANVASLSDVGSSSSVGVLKRSSSDANLQNDHDHVQRHREI